VVELADRRLRSEQRDHAVAGERREGEHVVALVAVEPASFGQARQPQERRKDEHRGERERVESAQGGTARLQGLIRINAELQPGDSGGPLLDSSGRVVGIDTAASTGYAFQSGSNDGYAIPIDRARAILGQIQASRSSASVHVGGT